MGNHPLEWVCTWGSFSDNPAFHSAGSDLTPMHYMQGNSDGYDHVACSGISGKLYDIFDKTTNAGRSLTVIVYNPFPPVDYYKNLSRYMDMFSSNEELMLEPKMDYEDWQPEELAFDENNPSGISDTILQTLEEKDCCILQGPPGTGKSYTIAKIVANYLEKGKSVCVTTMANKGLIELIKQAPLGDLVSEGKIYKTNLSIDEKKQIKALSSGMKVKYGLALALSRGAKILLLDEPTSGLDPVSRDELLDIFINLVSDKEHAILFSTHVISDLEKCADEIIYIRKGQIIASQDVTSFEGAYLHYQGESSILEPYKERFLFYRDRLGKFEGILPVEDKIELENNQVEVRKATLEEIMVAFERGKGE